MARQMKKKRQANRENKPPKLKPLTPTRPKKLCQREKKRTGGEREEEGERG